MLPFQSSFHVGNLYREDTKVYRFLASFWKRKEEIEFLSFDDIRCTFFFTNKQDKIQWRSYYLKKRYIR